MSGIGPERVVAGQTRARTTAIWLRMGDQPKSTAQHPPRLDLRSLALRQLVPALVLAAIAWLLWDRLHSLDTARIAAALISVEPPQWLAGLGLTAVSFWAVGHYDAVVHRLLGTEIETREAARTGATAIAVAQTVGMGAVTGAFVRWRLLPELSFLQAMRLSFTVALSFLAGWVVVSSTAVLLAPLPLGPFAPTAARLVLATAAALALLSILRPGPLARLRLPSLKAMGAILALTALDTIAAGLVLWVLLPSAIAVAPVTLVAAYVLALGAGLILTTPGGVGPFEVALITLLPGQPEEPFLAAIIAYRVLYYALPVLLGAYVLLRGPRPRPCRPEPLQRPHFTGLPNAPTLPFVIDAMIAAAPRAEAALLRHGRLGLLRDSAGRPVAMAAPSGQSLIVLSDPIARGGPKDLLTIARIAAKSELVTPVLYKIGARTAVGARRAGWSVVPVAQEAWLDPRYFHLEGAARRNLRRKLRKAESAVTRIVEVSPDSTGTLPLAEMQQIAQTWATTRGGERGFSMGIWHPNTLAWARVFLAYDPKGALLGFISLHANTREHTLDLMRPGPNAPDGLVYLLLAHAIKAAARDGACRFSLAAVPVGRQAQDPRLLSVLRERLDLASGGGGLRQFKSAFAPQWETLYAAAPSRTALFLGGLDIAREITRGAPDIPLSTS